VQSVHAQASVNSEDRKRRMFNETIASQSVSTRRPKSEKPSKADGSKAGDGKEEREQDLVRGVKPNLKRDGYWNAVSRATGAIYPRGSDSLFNFEPVVTDGDADGDDEEDTGQSLDDVGVEDGESRDDDDDVEKRWRLPIAVTKADPDQRLIYGWASIAAVDGQEIVDKQDERLCPRKHGRRCRGYPNALEEVAALGIR
jgi:hypothetical protein